MSKSPFLDIPPLVAANGTVHLPGSKSISNRVLLLAGLCSGSTTLHGVLDSDDTRVMLAALERIGCSVSRQGTTARITGIGGALPAQAEQEEPIELFLGNAGTAMRPLTAALAMLQGRFLMTGVPRMYERPIGDLVDGLRQLGCDVEYAGTEGYPPLRIGPACAECPKRTGNAPDLFGDVESDNVCTDPECFADKRAAHGARIVEEARAKGLEVLTGKEAKKVLPYSYSRPAGFVKLDDHNYQDEKNRTWAKILGKDAKAKVVLCEVPDEPGTFVELVREKDVNAILKAKGIEKVKAPTRRNELTPAERRADRERQIAREVNWQAYLALREVVGRDGFTQVELRAIARDALAFGTDIDERLVSYWGLGDDWTQAQAEEAIEKADGGALLQMVCDLTLGGGPNLSPLAAQRGIDVAAIEVKVQEEFKAKAEAEKAAAKKPAKGKAEKPVKGKAKTKSGQGIDRLLEEADA